MSGVRSAQGDAQRYRLLAFMRGYRSRNGFHPSIAEMARALGMQRTAILWHLTMLRSEGSIDYVDGHVARSLTLTDETVP